MKDEDKHILTRAARRDGFQAPEGYFDSFAERMAAQLPARPELDDPTLAVAAPKRGRLWQTVRPYAYMAAMFAGVWCMLKVFTMMGGTENHGLTIDSNPDLARAAANSTFIDEYVIDNISSRDVYDAMVEDSIAVYSFIDSVYNADNTLPTQQ